VTVITTSGRILAKARVAGGPHDTVFTAGGRRLWVAAERGRRLVELAMASGRVIRSVPMPGAPL
jgi:hypothetical protein